MTKIKAVRFSDDETSKIDKFLKANPGLDFSTLVRMAVFQMIKEPKLTKLASVRASKEARNQERQIQQ